MPSKNRLHIYIIFFSISLLSFFTTELSAQNYSPSQLKAAYVYNFGKEVKWGEPQIKDTFRIGFIGNDYSVLNDLNDLAKRKEIQKKPIKIHTFDSITQIKNVQILYVSNNMNEMYKEIINSTEKQKVVLVTDQYHDEKFIMINLLKIEDNTLKFELNKIPFIQKEMSFSNRMLASGGKEIDIAKLYQEFENEIISQKNELKGRQKTLSKFMNKINKSKREMEKYKNQAEVIENQLSELQNKINFQTHQMEEDKAQLIAFQETILRKEEELQSQTKKYKSNEEKAIELSEQIKQSEEVLRIQDSLIRAKENLINQQIEDLSTKDEKIDEQQTFLFYILAITIFVVVLLLIIYRHSRVAKRTAVLLAEKNKKIKDSQAQLIQSGKMASLGSLTAGVAHELNNPITFVTAGSYVLDRDIKQIYALIDLMKSGEEKQEEINALMKEIDFNELSKSLQETIKDINEGATRTADIVNGLRAFSAKDAPEKMWIDIHKSIDSTLNLLKYKFKNKIVVEKNYGDNLDKIWCHQGQINQVLMNLLVNALQSINDKGTITISTSEINETIIIKIKDTGSGISKKNMENIFDPFFTTKAPGSGTGLGLSISFGIIQNHKGTIEAKSKLGKGSEFTVTLPIGDKTK